MADLSARYREILTNEYRKRVEQNRRYSKNAFARHLGLDNTYFSKLSNGKILLSLDVAEKITRRLAFEPGVRTEFLLSAAEEQRCHALYLIAPELTDCDPAEHKVNVLPASRKKRR